MMTSVIEHPTTDAYESHGLTHSSGHESFETALDDQVSVPICCHHSLVPAFEATSSQGMTSAGITSWGTGGTETQTVSWQLITSLRGKNDMNFAQTLLRSLAGPVFGVFFVFLSCSLIDLGDPLDSANWWKCMVVCAFLWTLPTAAMLGLNLSTFFYQGKLHMDLHFSQVVAMWVIMMCIIVSVWWPLSFTGNQHTYKPLPFIGIVSACPAALAAAVYGWFSVPSQERAAPEIRQALCYVVVYNMLPILLVYLYTIVTAVLRTWIPNRPWLTVLVFLLMKLVLGEIIQGLIEKIDENKSFVGHTLLHTMHSFFIVVYLGTADLRSSSVYIVVGVDLFLNLLYLFQMWSGRFVSDYVRNCLLRCPEALKEEELERKRLRIAMRMTVSESSEFFLPLAYLAAVYTTYYGRDSHWLVGIGVSKFGLESVHSLSKLTRNIMILVTGDIAVTVITTFIVRQFGFHYIHYYAKELELFWMPAAVTQSWVLYTIICTTLVHCFSDITLEFAWWRQ